MPRLTSLPTICVCTLVASAALSPAAPPMYTVEDLGPGRANAISNSNMVVGWYAGYSIGSCMSWRGAGIDWQDFDLGSLGGDESEAFDVNDLGQVVGWAETDAGQMHAFGWTQAEGMVDLAVSDTHESCALGINNAGAVVGWYAGYSVGYSMSWDRSEPIPLGNLGGTTSEALGINDLDQVVGWAETESGAHHAFLWTESDGMVGLNDPLSQGQRA